MAFAKRSSEIERADTPEGQVRIDLAAAFRWAARLGFHEGIANHFSAMVSDDGRRFLVNPRWRHFSRIRASNLLLVDADDPGTMERPDAPDPTAWYIHGALHHELPQARCILHTHMPYATTLTTLEDPEIKPIDQNTARFYNRVAYDMHYGGIADTATEGERLAASLGNRSIMMMGQHGVLVAGKSVAHAFDLLYYLERACRNLVLAYSTGQPLNVMSHELAEATARDWEDYPDAAEAHFEEMKRVLDAKDPSYAN